MYGTMLVFGAIMMHGGVLLYRVVLDVGQNVFVGVRG